MFSFKDNQNTSMNEYLSPSKQTHLNFTKQTSQSQKVQKMNNLRHLYTSQSLNWNQPI